LPLSVVEEHLPAVAVVAHQVVLHERVRVAQVVAELVRERRRLRAGGDDHVLLLQVGELSPAHAHSVELGVVDVAERLDEVHVCDPRDHRARERVAIGRGLEARCALGQRRRRVALEEPEAVRLEHLVGGLELRLDERPGDDWLEALPCPCRRAS
jgi:hypothetical protein